MQTYRPNVGLMLNSRYLLPPLIRSATFIIVLHCRVCILLSVLMKIILCVWSYICWRIFIRVCTCFCNTLRWERVHPWGVWCSAISRSKGIWYGCVALYTPVRLTIEGCQRQIQMDAARLWVQTHTKSCKINCFYFLCSAIFGFVE